MSDRDDIESAYLASRAWFLTWIAEVEKEWLSGNVNIALGALENKLNQLPPDVKARSMAANPKEWAALNKQTKKKGA